MCFLFFQLLCHVFEQNAMELIFYYIDLSRNRDVRLAFEAHKVSRTLLKRRVLINPVTLCDVFLTFS